MSRAGFYASLPKKRMAAAALFFDAADRLLLVELAYREGWGLPGGVIEEDESPHQGCVRELKEELGWDGDMLRLLGVNYRPRKGERTEYLHFVFLGGMLNEHEIRNIQVPEEELKGFDFVPYDRLGSFLAPKMCTLLEHCLNVKDSGKTLYLEEEIPLW